MVIGNGMIAGRFHDYEHKNKFLVFASGVSDSSCHDQNEYRREQELLLHTLQQYPTATLVYCSTCSIYDPSLKLSPYVLHKVQMETLIREKTAASKIFRMSNPIGVTLNRHTMLNYFIDRIKNGDSFEVWAYASRNLIDLDDMYMLCDALLQSPVADHEIINIANPVNYPVTTIIETIEEHLNKKGLYVLASKGNSPLIDTSKIQPWFDRLQIDFSHHYLAGLLQKYFPV